MPTLAEIRRWDPVALQTAFAGFGAALLDGEATRIAQPRVRPEPRR